MGGVQKIETATFRVSDPEETATFLTDVMGLVPMDADEERQYFGCGMDDNYDLAITDGETGLDDVTFRVTDDEFDDATASLADSTVTTERRDRPGHARNVYFQLPHSDIVIGLVVPEENQYHHPAGATHFLDSAGPIADERTAVTPRDLDHIGIISPDIEADARFLVDTLGWKISDAKTTADGDWINAFIRSGNHHHDVSLFDMDPQWTHHHLAWAMTDMVNMKEFADVLASKGHQLELGFSRHGPGGNISIYFREPTGHRIEYTTEVATVDPDTPESIYDENRRDPSEGISLWGGISPPESFGEGT